MLLIGCLREGVEMSMNDSWLTVTTALVIAVYVTLPVSVAIYVGLRLWRDRKARVLGLVAIAAATVTVYLVGIWDPGVGFTAPWYFDSLFRGGSISNNLRAGMSLGDDGITRLGITVTIDAWAAAVLFAATLVLLVLAVALRCARPRQRLGAATDI